MTSMNSVIRPLPTVFISRVKFCSHIYRFYTGIPPFFCDRVAVDLHCKLTDLKNKPVELPQIKTTLLEAN